MFSIADLTGFEPGSDYPNPKVFERKHGRLVRMAPGKSYPAIIILEVRDTSDGVAAIGFEVSDIQMGADCKVYKEPRVSYSPLE